jgi:hypothetical protein
MPSHSIHECIAGGGGSRAARIALSGYAGRHDMKESAHELYELAEYENRLHGRRTGRASARRDGRQAAAHRSVAKLQHVCDDEYFARRRYFTPRASLDEKGLTANAAKGRGNNFESQHGIAAMRWKLHGGDAVLRAIEKAILREKS